MPKPFIAFMTDKMTDKMTVLMSGRMTAERGYGGSMAFDPRQARKRTIKLTSVRLTEEERLAVDWLTSRLGASAKEDYSVSDAIRIALARAIRQEAEAAERAGEPVPSAVREMLG